MDENLQDQWVSGKIDFTIKGEPVEIELSVPAAPVKLRRMLPIMQMMTSSFVEMSVKGTEQRGERISCKMGCGACCRQPVPLAEVEVYQIAELVENLPEPRRSEVKKRFADGVRRFHETKWFERMMDNFKGLTPQERVELGMEYFHEGIPCPFLENESCSIHTERPLICREYLVTSPSENCSQPSAQTIRTVPLLMEISGNFRRVAPSERVNEANSFTIPLIRALEWAEMYPENVPEKTGKVWLSEIFQQLVGPDRSAEQTETAGD